MKIKSFLKDLALFLLVVCGSTIIHKLKRADSDGSELMYSCLLDAFFLSVSGNSPVGLLFVTLFALVDEQTFDAFRDGIVARHGGLYDGMGSYALAFWALMCFVVPFVFQGLIFIACEALPQSSRFCARYKLQKDAAVAPSEMLRVLYLSVGRLIFFGLPFVMCMMAVTVMSKGQHGVDVSGPIPSRYELLLHFVGHVAVLEVTFYAVHRALHTPWLYRRVHKIHHEFTAPFAVASLHCHPLELVASNLFPVTAGFLVFDPHIFFVYMWIAGVALGTQTHHSGFRFPWISEADNQPDYHDLHHRIFNCNYGMLGVMDHIFATGARNSAKVQS